jgi:hypothetical protein
MTGADVQQQRDIATAVKNAREMALLPYTKRVAGLRGPRNRDDDRDDSRGGVSREVVERYENVPDVVDAPEAAAPSDAVSATPSEG